MLIINLISFVIHRNNILFRFIPIHTHFRSQNSSSRLGTVWISVGKKNSKYVVSSDTAESSTFSFPLPSLNMHDFSKKNSINTSHRVQSAQLNVKTEARARLVKKIHPNLSRKARIPRERERKGKNNENEAHHTRLDFKTVSKQSEESPKKNNTQTVNMCETKHFKLNNIRFMHREQ